MGQGCKRTNSAFTALCAAALHGRLPTVHCVFKTLMGPLKKEKTPKKTQPQTHDSPPATSTLTGSHLTPVGNRRYFIIWKLHIGKASLESVITPRTTPPLGVNYFLKMQLVLLV